jgi:mannose-6-phosphate isomerase-like protein (cupin superfamily)/quercetin dioxygenase-like cupin family protein
MDVMDVVEMTEGYAAPTCTATGAIRSTRFEPPDSRLWLVSARLDAASSIEWQAEHGDEAVYVLDGALVVDGQTYPAGTAVVVESGASVVARAEAPTALVHVGPVSPVPPADGLLGPPDPDGHGVHVVPPGAANELNFGAIKQVSFADGSCPTCRIAFFRVESTGDEPWVASSHLHSQDEIIHVLTGALQVGRTTVGPGMSIAIPAEQRYGFRTTGAFSFLNYRADVSTTVTTPGSEPILETVAALGSRRAEH